MNSLIAQPTRFKKRVLAPLRSAAPLRSGAPARSGFLTDRNIALWSAIYFGFHVVLGLAIHRFAFISTLHGLATVALGMWWAMTDRHGERVLYVAAYMTGAEVLWRMSQGRIFWEFGKYAIIAVLLTSILRRRSSPNPVMPLLYFAMLLPSVWLVLVDLDLDTARDRLSFNLSGPLALMVCAWFCSQLRLSMKQVKQVFILLLGPVVGVAAITVFSTVTSDITFTGESNKLTSGGFGPNQVSAILGLGVLLTLLCILIGKSNFKFRALMFVTMVLLAIQSALTFSRGGLMNAGGGAAVAIVSLSWDARARMRIILLALLLGFGGFFIILPRLDAFTDGKLATRFTDTGTTGRDLLVRSDLQIWADNPIFGVGPGLSTPLHAAFTQAFIAHTELSRLLSEHGSFGFLALILLSAMAIQCVSRTTSLEAKAVTLALLAWSFIYMLNAAMRLAAPAFIFGICFAHLLPELRTRAGQANNILAQAKRWGRGTVGRTSPRSLSLTYHKDTGRTVSGNGVIKLPRAVNQQRDKNVPKPFSGGKRSKAH